MTEPTDPLEGLIEPTEPEDHSPLEKPGNKIGPYRLLQVLGSGGMGEVWLAERREPYVQRVALKVVKPGMDTKAVLSRFEQERQVLAQMNHPNIAKVLDAGVNEQGRPYFVMEYVPGKPITEFADEQKLSIQARLEYFLQVCNAIAHAHQKGVIHRDIKPGNILVSRGEISEVGTGSSITTSSSVKVIDFGVAKAMSGPMTDQTVYTSLGLGIGTVGYMSPEQMEGDTELIGTPSDVYALGILLYELLSGSKPYDIQELVPLSPKERARHVRELNIFLPSSRFGLRKQDNVERALNDRGLGSAKSMRQYRELDWICIKALAPKVEDRYLTVVSLVEDIRRFLEGGQVAAGPQSGLYVLQKVLRKNLKATLVAVMVLFLLFGALVLERSRSTVLRIQKDIEQEQAESLRLRSEELSKLNDRNQDLLQSFRRSFQMRLQPESSSLLGPSWNQDDPIMTAMTNLCRKGVVSIPTGLRGAQLKFQSESGKYLMLLGTPEESSEIGWFVAQVDQSGFRLLFQIPEEFKPFPRIGLTELENGEVVIYTPIFDKKEDVCDIYLKLLFWDPKLGPPQKDEIQLVKLGESYFDSPRLSSAMPKSNNGIVSFIEHHESGSELWVADVADTKTNFDDVPIERLALRPRAGENNRSIQNFMHYSLMGGTYRIQSVCGLPFLVVWAHTPPSSRAWHEGARICMVPCFSQSLPIAIDVSTAVADVVSHGDSLSVTCVSLPNLNLLAGQHGGVVVYTYPFKGLLRDYQRESCQDPYLELGLEMASSLDFVPLEISPHVETGEWTGAGGVTVRPNSIVAGRVLLDGLDVRLVDPEPDEFTEFPETEIFADCFTLPSDISRVSSPYFRHVNNATFFWDARDGSLLKVPHPAPLKFRTQSSSGFVQSAECFSAFEFDSEGEPIEVFAFSSGQIADSPQIDARLPRGQFLKQYEVFDGVKYFLASAANGSVFLYAWTGERLQLLWERSATVRSSLGASICASTGLLDVVSHTTVTDENAILHQTLRLRDLYLSSDASQEVTASSSTYVGSITPTFGKPAPITAIARDSLNQCVWVSFHDGRSSSLWQIYDDGELQKLNLDCDQTNWWSYGFHPYLTIKRIRLIPEINMVLISTDFDPSNVGPDTRSASKFLGFAQIPSKDDANFDLMVTRFEMWHTDFDLSKTGSTYFVDIWNSEGARHYDPQESWEERDEPPTKLELFQKGYSTLGDELTHLRIKLCDLPDE